MKYDLSHAEKLTLISCLNSRLQEFQEDPYYNILNQYDYADWAENLNSKRGKNIDMVNKLLVKLGYKKNVTLFEDIIQRIKKLKGCKQFLLIGNDNDYYQLIAIRADYWSLKIPLKANITIKGALKEEWIKRSKNWVVSESKNKLVQLVAKKDALKLIDNCQYYPGTGPNDNMIRFLKVILK